MKTIVGFGALNLDLIFEVEDLKSISSKGPPLDPGEEGFGSDEEFESLLEQLKRFGTLKSKSGGARRPIRLLPWPAWDFQQSSLERWEKMKRGIFSLKI